MTNEELLRRWEWTINRDIFTWTEDLTLCWLAEQANHAQVIVEIGTYMGASAWTMLAANPTAHLWAIDLFMVAGTQKVTEYFLGDYIRQGQCEIIVGDSARGARMLQHMKGRIDLCFVDDGHATPDVIRDIRSFLPLMRPGGIICGHDFEIPHNDVAQGVIATGIKFSVPIPRLWVSVAP